MNYESTRGTEKMVSGAQAVINGIAGDGGLYVPEKIPPFSENLAAYQGKSYREVAAAVMEPYFPEFSRESFQQAVERAYEGKFTVPDQVVVHSEGNAHFLELFHGPTLAFKDMALSMLPELMRLSLDKRGVRGQIAILAATSGDTGKAAMEGFKNKKGFSIVVFYPHGKVSEMQYLQMATEQGKNCFVAAIEGNFDDAQYGVKHLFGDQAFLKKLQAKGISLSSANSINIGRLVPQIAYYVYGYLQLVKQGALLLGEPMNVSVPTGNFGNILAAWYARQMGLPIGKFICASNKNNVLTDFFQTGTYDKNRELFVTSSPSMDILVSSNLERLLFELSDRDGEAIQSMMDELSQTGRYFVSERIRQKASDFFASYAKEEAVLNRIRSFYEECGYAMDPHTCHGFLGWEDYQRETGDSTPCLIASTASPFKFVETMCTALGILTHSGDTVFDLARKLSEKVGLPVPVSIQDLEKAPARFTDSYPKGEMENVVARFLGV